MVAVEIKDLGQVMDHSLIYHLGNVPGGSMALAVAGTSINKTQKPLLIRSRHSPTNSLPESIIARTVRPYSCLMQTTVPSAEQKRVSKFDDSQELGWDSKVPLSFLKGI